MDGILRNMTSVYLVRDDEVLCLFRQGSRVADQKYIGSAVKAPIITRKNITTASPPLERLRRFSFI